MALRSIHFEVAMLLLGGILLVTTSLRPANEELYQTKAVGETLPMVKITNEVGSQKNQGENQSLSLVHFWAAYDAESRNKNVVYDTFLSASEAKAQLKYHAISVDIDEDIYKQTLTFDGIQGTEEQSLVSQSERQGLMELFGLKQGFHSFLVDASGKVLVIDPTVEELEERLKQI